MSKTTLIGLRITDDQKRIVEEVAGTSGCSIAQYLRMCLYNGLVDSGIQINETEFLNDERKGKWTREKTK